MKHYIRIEGVLMSNYIVLIGFQSTLFTSPCIWRRRDATRVRTFTALVTCCAFVRVCVHIEVAIKTAAKLTMTSFTSKDGTWTSCFRPGLFKNKVALVSGGGSGIGKAIAFELAVLGATVVIASRNHETCQQAAKEMNALLPKGAGKVVVGPSTSIRNEEEVRNLVSGEQWSCASAVLT